MTAARSREVGGERCIAITLARHGMVLGGLDANL
jgi:hypothetical protein